MQSTAQYPTQQPSKVHPPLLEGRKLQDGTRGREGDAQAQVGTVHEVISHAWQVKQVEQDISLRYPPQVWHLDVVLRGDLRGNM